MAEAEEICDQFIKNLTAYELDPSKEIFDELYRLMHSLKGSAYLFSFKNLGDKAHHLESYLEGFRHQSNGPSQSEIGKLFSDFKVIEIELQSLHPNFKPTGRPEVHSIAQNVSQEHQSSPEPTSINIVDKSKQSQDETNSSIRVSVNLLDNLMTLMGEMVLVRNQVIQLSNRSEDAHLQSLSKKLNVVTSEIQNEMMKTRLQPIGTVINKFQRVVRDLAQDLGKGIQLQIQGADTELDKSLLEAIKDPLTHIVRNSCDHGIESPQDRISAGKPRDGHITIRAYHEGGQVVIEVGDDGKGLHKERLISKAIEKGIISRGDQDKLSESDVFNLIFAPGFSTAQQVTNVSGRGVGMDVVRTNIEKIGGTIDLQSRTGHGTTIKLKIPLTLAIIPALIVQCGSEHFAIPQSKLEELVRVEQTNEENRVEILHGSPVFKLRGQILPLVDLSKVLKRNSNTNYDRGVINIAVVKSEETSFGIVFDAIQDTADIVVKPLNRLLKSLQIYSGATILGDGSVILILDILGVSKVARIGMNRNDYTNHDDKEDKLLADIQDYLLVGLASPTKHAFILNSVFRLEEFNTDQIEQCGNLSLVRYRDATLPIIDLNLILFGEKSKFDQLKTLVIVVRKKDKLYGLMVDTIVDTLSTDVEMETQPIKQKGLFGSLNLPDELIALIDPFEIINLAYPDQIQEPVNKPEVAQLQAVHRENVFVNNESKRILLAEDTVFFRKAIKNVLEKAGYQVITANDGHQALEIMIKEYKSISLLVSDIEMPKMNGFQLAEHLKNNPQLNLIPRMAISSRADSGFLKKGLESGFDMYLEKLNQDVLLNAVEKLMHLKREAA